MIILVGKLLRLIKLRVGGRLGNNSIIPSSSVKKVKLFLTVLGNFKKKKKSQFYHKLTLSGTNNQKLSRFISTQGDQLDRGSLVQAQKLHFPRSWENSTIVPILYSKKHLLSNFHFLEKVTENNFLKKKRIRKVFVFFGLIALDICELG